MFDKLSFYNSTKLKRKFENKHIKLLNSNISTKHEEKDKEMKNENIESNSIKQPSEKIFQIQKFDNVKQEYKNNGEKCILQQKENDYRKERFDGKKHSINNNSASSFPIKKQDFRFSDNFIHSRQFNLDDLDIKMKKCFKKFYSFLDNNIMNSEESQNDLRQKQQMNKMINLKYNPKLCNKTFTDKEFKNAFVLKKFI
jgi:hypothetical protein